MQESEWPIGTVAEIAQEVAWFLEREPGNEATENGGLCTHDPGPDSITRSQFRSRASLEIGVPAPLEFRMIGSPSPTEVPALLRHLGE